MKKIIIALSVFPILGFSQAQTPSDILSLKNNFGISSQKISELISLAHGALPAKNGIRTGGSDTGTDISAANISGIPSNSYLSNHTQNVTVFMGGANSFANLATNATLSVNSGKIALFEHANGIAGMTANQRAAVQATWAPTGSQLLTGGGVALGEVGYGFGAGNIENFGGSFPAEDGVDMPIQSASYTAVAGDASPGTVYPYYVDQAYLAGAEKTLSQMITGTGGKLMLPFINTWANVDDTMETGNYYKYTRELAIYAGGMMLDVPANFTLAKGDKYIEAIASAIRFSIANHLTVALVLSPFTLDSKTNCGFDANILQESQAIVSQLRMRGAIPTQYVIENYCPTLVGSDVNTANGDTVSGSLNQVALWLTTQPVSPAGTVEPIGGLSQSQIDFSAPNSQSYTALLANNSRSALPTAQISTLDIYNSFQAYAYPSDMAYQSEFSFNLLSGNIGGGTYLNGRINVFLNKLSTFLTQTPIVFQGAGQYGNQTLTGGNDNWLHVVDPYTTDVTKTGIALGTDANAPIISRLSSSGGVGFSDNISYNGSINYGIGVFGSNYYTSTDGIKNPYLQGGTADHLLHLDNQATTDPTLVGLAFSAGNVSTSFGTITGLASSKGLSFTGNIIDINGIAHLKSMKKNNILSKTIVWDGMIINDSDDHVPVISEGGKWYPLQLGKALQ